MSTTDERPASRRHIEHLPLSELLDDKRNPKQHDLPTIDASVGRFGFIESIVRDDRTGRTISGHGRTKQLRAMKERGEMPPEGVILREDGEWLVPVTVGWASRTDTEAAGALIALNRAGEIGGWVDDALLTLLDELSAQEDGLDGVGFDTGDIDDLRAMLQGPPDLDEIADQWPQDPSGPDDGATGMTIHITSPEVLRRWTAHRRASATDDAALNALLDAADVP